MNSEKLDKSSILVKNGTRRLVRWQKEDLTCVKFDTNSILDGKVALITLSRYDFLFLV